MMRVYGLKVVYMQQNRGMLGGSAAKVYFLFLENYLLKEPAVPVQGCVLASW